MRFSTSQAHACHVNVLNLMALSGWWRKLLIPCTHVLLSALLMPIVNVVRSPTVSVRASWVLRRRYKKPGSGWDLLQAFVLPASFVQSAIQPKHVSCLKIGSCTDSHLSRAIQRSSSRTIRQHPDRTQSRISSSQTTSHCPTLRLCGKCARSHR